MKKFFSFIAMAAVVLGLASCDPNGNAFNPDSDDYGVGNSFRATVQYPAPGTAAITVTANDKNCYFFAFHDPAVALPTWSKNMINEYLESYFEGSTYPEGLSEDQKELTAINLQTSTRYVVLMFKVGAGYTVDGDVDYRYFTTPESWR